MTFITTLASTPSHPTVWTLYVTDRVGNRQAQIDTYEACDVVARFNDVSSWSLTLPTDTEAGDVFATDSFARLELRLDDLVWRSGPVTHLERTVDLDGDMLSITGVDDTIWLKARNAHPQPGTAAPPYSTTAYDIHTGQLTTVLGELVNVNAGPGAVAARRVPGLTVPTPTPAGGVVTVNARWQNLLQLMQDTARRTVEFAIIDLALQVSIPADHGAVFSQGLETLGGWTLVADAPTTNKVVVAGGGVGTARLIRESQDAISIGTWGMYEAFQDRRDTTVVADLDQAAAESLAQGVKPVTVVFTPLDTPGQAFGHDWNLGDIVTVVAGSLTVVDQVREVRVHLEADAGATVTPSIGTAAGDIALFRSLAGLDRRVRQLERV